MPHYQKNPIIYTIYSNYVMSTYLVKTIYLLRLKLAYYKINIVISHSRSNLTIYERL